MLHGQFELIHPFVDGNGRLGRIPIPLFLFESKLLSRPVFYLSAYIEEHRDEYVAGLSALSSKQDGDAWNRWVKFFLQAVTEQAKKNLIKLNLKGSSIPHQVLGNYGSAQVLLKPASEGTGVIAGGPVRKVMQVAGIHNVLTKSLGTSNPHNVVKATFAALLSLKDAAHVAETRSKTVDEIRGREPREAVGTV